MFCDEAIDQVLKEGLIQFVFKEHLKLFWRLQ
jgi:hypothetical protein